MLLHLEEAINLIMDLQLSVTLHLVELLMLEFLKAHLQFKVLLRDPDYHDEPLTQGVPLRLLAQCHSLHAQY